MAEQNPESLVPDVLAPTYRSGRPFHPALGDETEDLAFFWLHDPLHGAFYTMDSVTRLSVMRLFGYMILCTVPNFADPPPPRARFAIGIHDLTCVKPSIRLPQHRLFWCLFLGRISFASLPLPSCIMAQRCAGIGQRPLGMPSTTTRTVPLALRLGNMPTTTLRMQRVQGQAVWRITATGSRADKARATRCMIG
jgi:hypothetical protein